ncbi:MAG: TRAP transporter large permease subunit [Treponema sp.]|nr:TRAP transporter large permease subunit [Treponema sp.]
MEQRHISLLPLLGKIEKSVCFVALISLVLIAASEAAARLFSASIPASTELLKHILLVLGLFSGMFSAKSGKHLSIALINYIKDEQSRRVITLITGFIAVFICTIIAWSSVSFIKIAIKPGFVGFIPNLVFVLTMPLAYCVMALRFAIQLPVKNRIVPLVAIVLGSIAAFPVIAKIIWGFNTPDSIFDLINLFYNVLFQVKLPLIILLIGLAIMGAPIFTVIAGIALIIIQSAGGEAETVNNSVFSALTDSNIIAIPLFTLTGFLLSESRAAERLVHSFRSLFGWLPGGMIIATVIICAFFTSFTGASGVTILALGGILFAVLTEKASYPERFTIGLLTSSGCIGILFPPSLPIILVGSAIRTNILLVFIGAIIPGIILVAAMIVMGITTSLKVTIPVEHFRLGKAFSSLKGSALELFLPVFLIVGFFSGIVSLVEVGAISVIYVFVAEVLIYKDIKFSEIPGVFYKALPIIGGVLSIIAMAKALSYAIVDSQAPENFARWMQGAIESKYIFLLLLNLALLIVGCLMDIFSAILVILPLIAPLGEIYGIDPVHLGIIFIINLEVGFLTPPVGLNLFLASYRFNKPFLEVCRYVLPFLIIHLAVVLLVTYIPVLSTYLPGLF